MSSSTIIYRTCFAPGSTKASSSPTKQTSPLSTSPTASPIKPEKRLSRKAKKLIREASQTQLPPPCINSNQISQADAHQEDSQLCCLSDELLLQICLGLTYQELVVLSGLSRKFYYLIEDPSLWKAKCGLLQTQLNSNFQQLSNETWRQFFASLHGFQKEMKRMTRLVEIETPLFPTILEASKFMYRGECGVLAADDVLLDGYQCGQLILTSFPRLLFKLYFNKGSSKPFMSFALGEDTKIKITEQGFALQAKGQNHTFEAPSGEEALNWKSEIEKYIQLANKETCRGPLKQCRDCGTIFREKANFSRACYHHPGIVMEGCVQKQKVLFWSCCQRPTTGHWKFEQGGCQLKGYHTATTKATFSPFMNLSKFLIF